MGRKETTSIKYAGWDPRKPTSREELALARMEGKDPGVQDFIAVENLCNRCHEQGCFLDFDDEEQGDASLCPGYCFARDAAWKTWGLICE